MSIVIMNIGLAIPQTDDEAAKGLTRFWQVGQAEDALYRTFAPLGYQALRTNLVQSASEPTLVAVFQLGNGADESQIRTAAMILSTYLEQDCIAYIAHGKGELIGPKAAAWGGKFDHRYFMYPSNV